MGVSEIDLANLALGHLSRDTIRTLDDKGPAAVEMKRNYRFAISKVLEEFDWPFSRVVTTLLEVTGIDKRGWTYAFAIPPDCIKIWRIQPPRTVEVPHPEPVRQFEIGMSADPSSTTTYVFADEKPLAVAYTSSRTTLARVPQLVVDLMARDLAAKSCMVLAKNINLKRSLEQDYIRELSKVKTDYANLEPELFDVDFVPEAIAVRSQ